MMDKIFVTNGCSNHTDKDRQTHDYYATDPKCVNELLEVEQFQHNILEPCCGEGHISKELIKHGYNVTSSDLIDRGFGTTKDLLSYEHWSGDIITNPPYKNAVKYVKHCLDIVDDGAKVAMFLKITFLESKERLKFFKKYPPKYVYVYSSRRLCALNGDFEKSKVKAICYCWFIWVKGYKGEPTIRWIE